MDIGYAKKPNVKSFHIIWSKENVGILTFSTFTRIFLAFLTHITRIFLAFFDI